MQLTIIIDGDEVSTASHGIEVEKLHEGIATAEPAPERFSGSNADDEVVRDALPAPARFQPSSL